MSDDELDWSAPALVIPSSSSSASASASGEGEQEEDSSSSEDMDDEGFPIRASRVSYLYGMAIRSRPFAKCTDHIPRRSVIHR